MTSSYSVSSARLSAGAHSAVTSGYLLKEAHIGRVVSHWHRRFYVLYSDGLLCSFKNSRSPSPHKVIPVGRQCLRLKFGHKTSNRDCKWPKNVPTGQRFSVINSDRDYHFCCQSEQELSNWQFHLSDTLSRLAKPNADISREESEQLQQSDSSEQQPPSKPAGSEGEREEQQEDMERERVKTVDDDVIDAAHMHNELYERGSAGGEGVPPVGELTDESSSSSVSESGQLDLILHGECEIVSMVENSFNQLTTDPVDL